VTHRRLPASLLGRRPNVRQAEAQRANTDRVLLDTTIVRDEAVVEEQFDDVVAAIARGLGAAANEVRRRR
jgi:hypothetical protein